MHSIFSKTCGKADNFTLSVYPWGRHAVRTSDAPMHFIATVCDDRPSAAQPLIGSGADHRIADSVQAIDDAELNRTMRKGDTARAVRIGAAAAAG